MQAELLIDSRCELAEGIQWHAGLERLFWTDIQESVLWSCDADGDGIERWALPERLGCFAFDRVGNVLMALESGLHAFDLADNTCARIGEFEADIAGTRTNDGRCDRSGAFLYGGVTESGSASATSFRRFGPDGNDEVLLPSIQCSNSTCFSIDGATLYFADSPTLQIRKYAYSASGPLEDRGVFAQLDPDTGIPDGSCIDADNSLWNTQYGGGLTQRYLADGSRDLQVELPVSQVTCCCFGGPDYSRLYISTAAQRLSVDARATQPLAGGIFVCEPGVNGVAEDGFAGDAFALAR